MNPVFLLSVAVLLLAACSSGVKTAKTADPVVDGGPPPGSIDVSAIPDAVPKNEPRSRYGNPESYVVHGKRYYVMDSGDNYVERGIASWYGEKFHGRRTSSGEAYDMYAMTAAHKSLPLPGYVQVRNLENGKTVIVRVNDRGPFHDNRIIDLSYTAAAKLDILAKGTGLVEVRSIGPSSPPRRKTVLAGASAGEMETGYSRYGDGGFYIQVGAFAQRLNAEKMRDRLTDLADARIVVSETTADGKPLFRVRIGPITEVAQADRIVSGLGTYGIHEHHIAVD